MVDPSTVIWPSKP